MKKRHIWRALLIGVVAALPLSALPVPAVAQAPSDYLQPPKGVNFTNVLRLQRKILFGQARKLAPQRPGVVDLYFIAVGGDAKQGVFANEVAYARDEFDRKFDTKGRSLVLSNSYKTYQDQPLATLENLRLAMNYVAHIMDVKEDIVFIFLTMHGSHDHQLWLDMPPLNLEHLTVPVFQKLLGQSKLQNKVIVVSACYSGGFVDGLADDYSLIMTASAADRSSFGCSNSAKFTYFGRAYFVEALQDEYSFIGAFAKADRIIAGWEQAQRFTPSMPQIRTGRAILPKLNALERRLRAGLRTARDSGTP